MYLFIYVFIYLFTFLFIYLFDTSYKFQFMNHFRHNYFLNSTFYSSFLTSHLFYFYLFLISLKNELAALRISRDDAVALKLKLVERQGELELANRMIEEEIKRETKDKVSECRNIE